MTDPVDPSLTGHPTEPRSARVARWRAGWVAVHLVALSLLGIPEPEVDPDDLDDPEIQAWFDSATQRLQAWGLPVTREQVYEHGVRWGQGYVAFRRTVLAPIYTYTNFTGTHQSWRMFADVPKQSAVLFIEAKLSPEARAARCVGAPADCGTQEWTLLFRNHYNDPPAAPWRINWWHQERMRSLVNLFVKKKNKGDFDRLKKFITPWLWQDFPEATSFRMGMQAVAFPPPEKMKENGNTLEFGKRWWVSELPKPEATDVQAP